MKTSDSPAFGVGLVALSIGSVQFGAAIGKTLFDDISPAGLTLLRLAFAAAIMLVVACPDPRGWRGSTWMSVLGLGATLGLMNLLYYASLASIPLAVAVTCELMGPLVLSLVLSRRIVEALWVLLAAAGVAIIGVQSWAGDIDLGGVLLALAAGACWALYIVLSRRVGARVPGVRGLSAAMLVGAVVALPFGAGSAIAAVAADASILLPALLIAVLSSVLAYGLEMMALRRIVPRVFGVLMSLEPAAAALFGFIIVHETVGLWSAVAIALVIAASAGVAITAARTSRREPRPVSTDTGAMPPIVQ